MKRPKVQGDLYLGRSIPERGLVKARRESTARVDSESIGLNLRRGSRLTVCDLERLLGERGSSGPAGFSNVLFRVRCESVEERVDPLRGAPFFRL